MLIKTGSDKFQNIEKWVASIKGENKVLKDSNPISNWVNDPKTASPQVIKLATSWACRAHLSKLGWIF